MKVTNTSAARVRIVEPQRWVAPGETVVVDDDYGKGLLAGGSFERPKAKSEPTAPDGSPVTKEQD